MTELTHKQWLDNEYSEWVKALKESTVHNFKEHPGVRRMLSLDLDRLVFWDQVERWANGDMKLVDTIAKIDLIGYEKLPTILPTGIGFRNIYYATEVLKLNPSSICEIGGGVGQFYATLRALGFEGNYMIKDIIEVELFQIKYLEEVEKQTGLELPQFEGARVDLLVSFYALGEFDAAKRQRYEQLIDETPHGYIAWNPHSGASDSLSIFENHDIKVTPGIEPGVSIIEW